VVISAAWGGIPRQVVDAWFAERYVLLITPAVLAEYHKIFERLLPRSLAASRFLHAVYLKAVAVHPTERAYVVRHDPTDDRFLECAMAGRADYLVSGDHHLLQIGRFRETKILTPRAFLGALH